MSFNLTIEILWWKTNRTPRAARPRDRFQSHNRDSVVENVRLVQRAGRLFRWFQSHNRDSVVENDKSVSH